MGRGSLPLGTVVLLAGPTVLAFFSGGYFDGPRAAAAAIAWALVLWLTLRGPLPLPTSTSGRAVVIGLVGLTVWTAVSVTWAPLIGPVSDSVQRLLLYTAVFLAASTLLRDPRSARAVEPALALGVLIVIGYGLMGRLVPGLVEFTRSATSGGRLEQPITYWNAEGLLAAIGLVLLVRLAGDRTRSAGLRVAAAAACAPVGVGAYLSYSRGALAVAVLGLIILLAICPTWTQLRAAFAGVLAAVAASLAASVLTPVAALNTVTAAERRGGAIMLAALVGVMVISALWAKREIRVERERDVRFGRLAHGGRLPGLAVLATSLCLAGLVAGGLAESATGPQARVADPSRLASATSVRYEYWRVAFDAFAERPIQGVGAGGFRVVWRLERRVGAGVNEVHSLVLETAAELGLPGLLFLFVIVGGVVVGARRAMRSGAPLAPGACAVLTVWILHACIDWDWQMPAVTLPAIVLAGGLFAAEERSSWRPPPSDFPFGQSQRDVEAAGEPVGAR